MTDQPRPSYKAAAVAAAATFALYILTLSPSAWMWDTGEYMAAVRVLGLPHPPGNPLFILIANSFAKLPLPGGYAQHINTLSALSSAASAGIWFLVTERIVSGWLEKHWQRITAASVSALIGGTAFTVWNQSVVNEKVYTVSLLFFAIVSWLMLRWMDDARGRRANRKLLLVFYLLGLGYANHPAGFLAGPAVAVAVLVTSWRILLDWRLISRCIACLALGLTPFLFEPVRSAQFPIINSGETTGCTTKIEVGCTFSKVTKDRLMYNINREQYGAKIERYAPYTSQVAGWWLYFKWQWLRDLYSERIALQAILAVIFLSLGVIGGYVHWKMDRKTFLYFGPLMFTLTLALIYYMNFKFGWSQSPELGDTVDREVRDRDYFYIWSFSAWGIWAAVGLSYIWMSLAEMLASRTRQPSRAWALSAPVLLIAAVPLIGNFGVVDHRGDTFARDYATDMLSSVEPYGILITNGDNDTYPLWYAQEVEGVRKDVMVLVGMHFNTDWSVRQMIRREIRPYDAEKGPDIYRRQQWMKPTAPPLKLTFDQADAIPPYVELSQPQLFQKGNILARIEPGVLDREQLVTLQLIKDTFPERPIYFPIANNARKLGLDNYLLIQGLVERLVDHPIVPKADTIKLNDRYVDVSRTGELWKLYRAPDTLAKIDKWIDPASANLPGTYLYAGLQARDALVAAGERDTADKVTRKMIAVAKALRMPRESIETLAAPQ
ncbi:MAG TPA: DUF2723 domain-containing protein [Gemmatimonadaceae bacterium]|nr:DUF2723 domain-containing protein [Gemmatimonadaceae bacterium]